jgi:CheY-like chemotaxis protein
MRKYKCIVLIDDNHHDNFYHQFIIEDADCAEKIIAFNRAEEALTYLELALVGGNIPPELIFLDINMPMMNGFEFMDEYRKFDQSFRDKIRIIMLSTSLNPADQKRASTYKDISAYYSKPLTIDILSELDTLQ